jgi:hypothetical protein
MISASIMLSVGHAVAYNRIARSSFINAQAKKETYFEAFGWLFAGGIGLLVLAALFAAVASWSVLRPTHNPPMHRTGPAPGG